MIIHKKDIHLLGIYVKNWKWDQYIQFVAAGSSSRHPGLGIDNMSHLRTHIRRRIFVSVPSGTNRVTRGISALMDSGMRDLLIPFHPGLQINTTQFHSHNLKELYNVIIELKGSFSVRTLHLLLLLKVTDWGNYCPGGLALCLAESSNSVWLEISSLVQPTRCHIIFSHR